MAQRRSEIRHEVQIGGKLIWSDGARIMDCVIVDLSTSGACVETASTAILPEKLDLFEGKSGNVFECQVRWKNVSRAGLLFLDMSTRSKRQALIERHSLRADATA